MLRNYFAAAINNLLKNRLYSAITIIGLAVGLSAFLLIGLYVRDELSYDRHWDHADRLYRLVEISRWPNQPALPYPFAPLSVLSALRDYFPGMIETGGRRMFWGQGIAVGDKVFREDVVHLVDKTFIDLFQFDVIVGNLESTFLGVNTIALREDTALNYFGGDDPIGKTLTLRIPGTTPVDYRVTAVYRLAAGNTVLTVPNMALLDDAALVEYVERRRESNQSVSAHHFLRISPSADAGDINTRLPAFIDLYAGMLSRDIGVSQDRAEGQKLSDRVHLELQRLSGAYLNPLTGESGGDKTTVMVFMAIAFLILLVGGINFVTLTTARAGARAREVAMRRVVGAKTRHLVQQFLGESILITALALALALGVVELLLPFFENFINKDLNVPYSSIEIYPMLLLLAVVPGALAGLYPALVLSRFRPSRTLKANQSSETQGSITVRNVLVVFQFAVSIALMVATVVVYGQLLHTRNIDLGFDPDNLLGVWLFGQDVRDRMDVLRNEVAGLPGVTGTALAARQPNNLNGVLPLTLPLRVKEEDAPSGLEVSGLITVVDYGFAQTYRIPLLAGRFFDPERDPIAPPSTSTDGARRNPPGMRKAVINLMAASQLGFRSAEAAVDGIIQVGRGRPGAFRYIDYQVIGVVGDTQFRSLRAQLEAEVYTRIPGGYYALTARFQAEPQQVMSEVGNAWERVMGDAPLLAYFIEQDLGGEFAREENEGRMLMAFSLLAVFIACLGLYGMASFTVERRVKEIGLRKVMGAKVKDIVGLLVWQFSKPVLIANLIAWPIAIWAMQGWLRRFPYQIDGWLLIPICLGAGLMALAVAWLTVAGNTARAARRNPIHALRYE